MKPQAAFIVFLILLGSSVIAGIDSLMTANKRAQYDVERALRLTLAQCEPDHVDRDTIQVYRSHITMEAVRDTAYLSIVGSGGDGQTLLTACTGLTIGRLWAISDQRASGVLALLAALWMLLYWGGVCRLSSKQNSGSLDIVSGHVAVTMYDSVNRRFYGQGHLLHFTPMQQKLMEMFMEAPTHLLTQREICDRLWPKKPDASATLYTLIRRLKPILKQEMQARIECHRGEAYQLIFSEEEA